MTREQHAELIKRIRETAGEEIGALISDDLAELSTDYVAMSTSLEEKDNAIKKLENDKNELLQTNSKLFLRLGEEVKDDVSEIDDENDDEEITMDEIVNEKGEFIE